MSTFGHEDGGRAPAPADPLRARFEAAAPAVAVDPDRIVRRGRRQRALARAGGVLGSLALVAVVLLVARPGGGPAPVAAAPPAEEVGDVSLWLSATEVPTGPATIVSALVAHTDTDAVFGVGAEVERWDGRAWWSHRLVGLCLAEWRCVAPLVADPEGFGVNDIGLSATPARPGPAQLMSTEGLEEGWYRLVQDAVLGGPSARAVFRVTDDAPPTPPVPSGDGVSLVVDPVLVPPTGGQVDLAVHVPPDASGTLTAEDIAEAEAQLADLAVVERWDGAGWVPVGEVEVPAPRDQASPVPLTLPALEPGPHRLVRGGPDGDAWGVLWVADEAAGGRDGAAPDDDVARPPADPARFGLDDL
ncbi:MAG: hypothetical protein H5T83_13185, partial [Actinotalea sp.]|nr:hypothetical protein [Actinotalea sp.]